MGTLRPMALARQRMTADEFLALPPLDQYRHAELIDGELVVDQPKLPHQRVVLWLATEIGIWIRQGRGRGEVLLPAVRLTEQDVFVPDLVWVPEGYRYPHDLGALLAPPPLAVEVRSPTTWRHDRGHKRRVYEARGIAELWLVDHLDRAVHVHRRSSPASATFDVLETLTAGDELATPLLPGLTLDMTTLLDVGAA